MRAVDSDDTFRVPMAEFRGALESLGYTGVRTLLNSGNAVFSDPGRSAKTHAAAIHAALAADPSRLRVVFTQDPNAIRELAALEPLLQPHEQLCIGKHAAYLHCASGILESAAGNRRW